MLLILLHLAACAPAADSSATVVEGLGATFGSASGACPGIDEVTVDVGAEIALVQMDACGDEGEACRAVPVSRIESGSSVWAGACDEGFSWTMAWVVPA